MAVKVVRSIFGNLAATGFGNPIIVLLPIMLIIIAFPILSLFEEVSDFQSIDQTNSTAIESYNSSLASSLMLVVLFPIMLIALLIPFLTGGFGGRPNIRGIIKTANIEKRMEKLKKLGTIEFIKATKGHLLDSSPRGNKLYSSKEVIQGKTVKYLIYQDKSTPREYISFVPEKYSNADEAMAFKFGLSSIEYDRLKLENEA